MPNALKDVSDDELLASYQKEANKRALGELFKRYSLMCFSVANKYLKNEDASQDAVMQIFENLFEDLPKHQVHNFKSWLFSVTKNYCLMQLRRPNLLQQIAWLEDENSFEFMENIPQMHLSNNAIELEEKLQNLEKAIFGLNPKQQTCIRLFYLNNLSYEEVCAQTGYDLNEVKSAIQNGKRNLKIILAENGITYLLICLVWMQQSA
jgi:RNA polymerase sigma-70 factor (ECF subfamily)